MKIAGLKVDDYGAWSDLAIDDLSDGVTVFYGANEAGKTTLLQFIRGVLYGLSDPSRRKYARTRSGRKPGGELAVEGALGQVTLVRQGDGEGKTWSLSADGERFRGYQLRELLSNVDESIFNNVFAVGLQEMQELGTLSDTDAARWLYNLTGGLDRVSLVDVMRELRQSCERLHSSTGQPGSQIANLLLSADQLRTDLSELEGQTAFWMRLEGQIVTSEKQSKTLEEGNQRLAVRVRLVETATVLGERWEHREKLETELRRLGPLGRLNDDTIASLNEHVDRLKQARACHHRLRAQHDSLRLQYRAIELNQPLWRQLPRIEALADQQEWIGFLENRIGQFEGEVAAAQEEWGSLSGRFGLAAQDRTTAPEVSPSRIAGLRAPADALETAERQLAAAQEETAQWRSTFEKIEGEILAGMESHDGADLSEALEHAGNRVTLLRRRVQLDEKGAEFDQAQRELEEDADDLVDRQLMPVWVTVAIGVALIAAVVSLVIGYSAEILRLTLLGWLLGVVGVLAGIMKQVMEKSTKDALEDCEEQLEMLRHQRTKLQKEREEIDSEIPSGGGPLAVRLQAAEQDLATLEELLPAESRRRSAGQEGKAIEFKLEQTRKAVDEARLRWNESLTRAGLPSDLLPEDLGDLQDGGRRMGEVRQRLEMNQSDLEARRRELQLVTDRISQLIVDAGISANQGSTIQQIDQLVLAAQQQAVLAQQRDGIRKQGREIRREAADNTKTLRQCQQQCEAILEKAGVANRSEFSKLTERYERGKSIRSELKAMNREIEAALGTNGTEDDLAQLMDERSTIPLEKLWEELETELEAKREELKRLAQQRGQFIEQRRVLLEDRRLGEKRCELATVEAQIDEALTTWQVRGTASQLLESIREEFELTRQPETLIEASRFLSELTQDKYRRVWTPFGEEALNVEDCDGVNWSVDHLSRGTREQLFLSLRLALVSLYARRGVKLPVILDDVLVNFDAERAKAAARVLRDFAKQGHQLLVFTCHEHVWKMFKSLKMDARRLPVHKAIEEEELLEDEEVLDEEPEDELLDEDELDEEEEEECEYDEIEEEEEEEIVDEEDEEDAEEEEEDETIDAEDEEEPWEDEEDEELVDETEEELVDEEEEEDEETDEAAPAQKPRRARGAHGWKVEFDTDPEDESEAA